MVYKPVKVASYRKAMLPIARYYSQKWREPAVLRGAMRIQKYLATGGNELYTYVHMTH